MRGDGAVGVEVQGIEPAGARSSCAPVPLGGDIETRFPERRGGSDAFAETILPSGAVAIRVAAHLTAERTSGGAEGGDSGSVHEVPGVDPAVAVDHEERVASLVDHDGREDLRRRRERPAEVAIAADGLNPAAVAAAENQGSAAFIERVGGHGGAGACRGDRQVEAQSAVRTDGRQRAADRADVDNPLRIHHRRHRDEASQCAGRLELTCHVEAPHPAITAAHKEIAVLSEERSLGSGGQRDHIRQNQRSPVEGKEVQLAVASREDEAIRADDRARIHRRGGDGGVDARGPRLAAREEAAHLRLPRADHRVRARRVCRVAAKAGPVGAGQCGLLVEAAAQVVAVAAAAHRQHGAEGEKGSLAHSIFTNPSSVVTNIAPSRSRTGDERVVLPASAGNRIQPSRHGVSQA